MPHFSHEGYREWLSSLKGKRAYTLLGRIPSSSLSQTSTVLLREDFFRMAYVQDSLLVALANARCPSEGHAFSDLDEVMKRLYCTPFCSRLCHENSEIWGPSGSHSYQISHKHPPPDNEDRKWCPVAFLRAYINRSKKIRALTQRRPFISINSNY